MVGQEAHAKDVWPIGYEDALCSTHTAEERNINALVLLGRHPCLLDKVTWFIDPPTSNPDHHVGGQLNDVLGVWPHKYAVFDSTGKLLFRNELKRAGPGLHYVDFTDLETFMGVA